MEEYVYYNNLFDIYSSLLTLKENLIFKDYYQEDLSLSEIAENRNITRSAVQKTVKTVLSKLEKYENILNIYKKNTSLKEILELDDITEIKKKINEILEH